MKRNFINKDNPNNYWSIEIKNMSYDIISGIGYSISKKNSKSFDTYEKCLKEADRLINKTLKDGYEEVHLYVPDVHITVLKKIADAQRLGAEKLEVNVNGSLELVKIICTIESLKELTLSTLSSIPHEIRNLHNLEYLIINSSPELNELSEEIGSFKKLKKLHIGGTSIRQLPNTIANLQSLNQLVIHDNNQLEFIPDAIGRLKQLRILHIYSNREFKLKQKEASPLQLSEAIGALENLEDMVLLQNDIVDLPLSVQRLKRLKTLDLRMNLHLEKIPPVVFELEALNSLTITNCAITEIPVDLCRLKHLDKFTFDEDKIINLPEDVLEEDAHGIIKYLNEVLINGESIMIDKPEDKYLLSSYEAVYSTTFPSVFQKFILSRAFRDFHEMELFDEVSKQKFNITFITDISIRGGGLLDQLIRITMGKKFNTNEPVGFADAIPIATEDGFEYQLAVIPIYEGNRIKEDDPCPVYLVKYKGYPSEGYNKKLQSDFECDMYPIAGDFEQFIKLLY